jgi:hypothetical protein
MRQYACYYPHCNQPCSFTPGYSYFKQAYQTTEFVKKVRQGQTYADAVKGTYSHLFETLDPHEEEGPLFLIYTVEFPNALLRLY